MAKLPPLLCVLFLICTAADARGGRRSLLVAPAPAPAALDMPSGGGGTPGCVAADTIAPPAEQLIMEAASGMLSLCSSGQADVSCGDVVNRASLVVSLAASSTLGLAALEGTKRAECANDATALAQDLHAAFDAGLQAACMDPSPPVAAGSQLGDLLVGLAADLPAMLAGQSTHNLSTEEGVTAALTEVAASIQPNVAGVLAAVASACPFAYSQPQAGPSPPADGSSDGATPSPDPGASPNPPASGSDLGSAGGAAALAALEQRRHDGMMTIISGCWSGC